MLPWQQRLEGSDGQGSGGGHREGRQGYEAEDLPGFSAEEKILIVLEGSPGEERIETPCRGSAADLFRLW